MMLNGGDASAAQRGVVLLDSPSSLCLSHKRLAALKYKRREGRPTQAHNEA
jgi:hypothetical protein